MNNTISTAFLLICCSCATSILATDYTLDRTVDYQQVLGPHDFVFDEAPTSYADCAFIGNGMIGSTIWARPGEAVHWSLGRNDVYNTRERRGSRLLIGNLSVQLQSPVVSQPMLLSLHKAEASGRIETEKGAVQWRSITPQSSDVGLIEYTVEGDEQVEIRFDSLPAVTPGQLNTYLQEHFPKDQWPSAKFKADEYGNPLFREFYKTLPTSMRTPATRGADGDIDWLTQFCNEGQGYALAYGTRKLGGGRFLYAYSIDSLAKGETRHDIVTRRVRAALQQGYAAIADEHYRWWDTYYRRTFVSIPDSKIARYYWIQIFKPAPPAIESVLCQTIGVHEMLLQSKATRPDQFVLRVFPAMPTVWEDAAFDRLIAEGAFEVSGKWENGHIAFVEITSKAGKPCNVMAPFDKMPKALGEREFKITQAKTETGEAVYTIDLEEGEKVLLVNAEDDGKAVYSIASHGSASPKARSESTATKKGRKDEEDEDK